MSQEKYLVPDIECSEFFTYIKKFKELYDFYVCDGYKMYKYIVDDDIFYVYESDFTKIVSNCKDYNCGFNKRTGFTIKFGSTIDDDPYMCKLGPEIMDLEISINGCPKVGGHNCKFCYKNNSDIPPTNMSFDTFKKIIDKFPKCLNQIAFGITGTQTNPDFPKMLEYCREIGIIPNYTMSGADLNDDIIEVTKKYCGAVAISCYEDNKELCYNTIYELSKKAPNVHVNMHIVLSKGTFKHVMDVLNDIKKEKVVTINKTDKTCKLEYLSKNEKIRNLRHIVFLRIKPVGRASTLDTTIPLDMYEEVIKFCDENHISYGFDSCSAKQVMKVLRKTNQEYLCNCCEPCESTKFSIYISANGKITPCSFCEKLYEKQSIDIVNNDESFIDIWNNNELLNLFRSNSDNEKSCSIYNLDE